MEVNFDEEESEGSSDEDSFQAASNTFKASNTPDTFDTSDTPDKAQVVQHDDVHTTDAKKDVVEDTTTCEDHLDQLDGDACAVWMSIYDPSLF